MRRRGRFRGKDSNPLFQDQNLACWPITPPRTAAGSVAPDQSSLLRRLQTGSVRAYAGSLFIGVVLILGYYLWR